MCHYTDKKTHFSHIFESLKLSVCTDPLWFKWVKWFTWVFLCMWQILLWLSDAHHISFELNRFSVKYWFPFPTLRFLPSVTQRSVPQENAFKRSKKTLRLFPRKTIGSIHLYNCKQFQVFKIAKFDFKVTVHYRLWAKYTQLWPLNNRGLVILFVYHGWTKICSPIHTCISASLRLR